MSSLFSKLPSADPMMLGMTGIGLLLGVVLALGTASKKGTGEGASKDQVEAGSSKAKGKKNKKKKPSSANITEAAHEAKQEIASEAPPASLSTSPSSSSLLRPAKNQPSSILSPASADMNNNETSDKVSASRVSFASVASSSSASSAPQAKAAGASDSKSSSSLGAAASVPPGSAGNKHKKVSKDSIVEHTRTAEAVTAAGTDAGQEDVEDTQGDESLARRLQAESDGSRDGRLNGDHPRSYRRDEDDSPWESVSGSKAARSTTAAAASTTSNGSTRGANGAGGKFASANPFAVLPSDTTFGDSSFSSSKSGAGGGKVASISSGGKPSRNSILFSAAASTAPSSSSKPAVPGAAASTSGNQNCSTAGPSKKQRQNATRRDKEKAAKAEAEAERLAALARHKKELEAEKMREFNTKQGKGNAGGGGKVVSGGQKASVDERGNLVWS